MISSPLEAVVEHNEHISVIFMCPLGLTDAWLSYACTYNRDRVVVIHFLALQLVPVLLVAPMVFHLLAVVQLS